MSETLTIPKPDVVVESDGIFTMWSALLSSLSVTRTDDAVLLTVNQSGQKCVTFRFPPDAAERFAEYFHSAVADMKLSTIGPVVEPCESCGVVDTVWTSPLRKRAVSTLIADRFTPVDIALLLSMDIGKVRLILKELAADERANDAVRSHVGPFMPLTDTPDQGGATGTGGAL